MKKVLFMALVIMASALTANATGKDDKKQKKQKKTECSMEQKACAGHMNGGCAGHMMGGCAGHQANCCAGEINWDTPAVLTTQADSVSYAAGMAVTQGLIQYMQSRMDLDTTFIADFKQGFEDAIARGTDPKFAAYNAGLQIASQVQKQILPSTSDQFDGTDCAIKDELFYKGFLAGAMGDNSLFTTEAAATYSHDMGEKIKKQQSAAYIEKNTAWLAENAKKEGVVVLPSGLQYKVITAGNGAVATANDNVTVKYEGKMIDGTVFDSSYTRNPDTTSFKPTQVIKGWTEALCMMPEGSKWELYIPQELGYGERPAGKIKPYSTLIFTVEVVKVEK